MKLGKRSNIVPVAMDQKKKVLYDSNSDFWVIGFGDTDVSPQQRIPEVLHHAKLSHVPRNRCRKQWDARGMDIITKNMICATYPGKDTCQGGKKLQYLQYFMI